MKESRIFLIYNLTIITIIFAAISVIGAKTSNNSHNSLTPISNIEIKSTLIYKKLDEEPERNFKTHVQGRGTHEKKSKADITLAVIALPHVYEREAVALLHHWLRVQQQSSFNLIG